MNDILKPLLGKLSIFAKKRMGFSYPPRLFLRNDYSNSRKALGKTAYYDPNAKSITLYVHSRHPKDILRSYAHELVHHTQNLRGDLSPEKCGTMGADYAQKNQHMRNMEKEAYLQGNMCFRDWEDTLDDKDIYIIKIAESKYLKENKKMTTKITKNFLMEEIERHLKEYIGIATADNEADLRSAARSAMSMSKARGTKFPAESVLATGRKLLSYNTKESTDLAIEYLKYFGGVEDNEKAASAMISLAASAANQSGMIANDPSKKEKPVGYMQGLMNFLKTAPGIPRSKKEENLSKEQALYEERFGQRNKKLFESLSEKWIK